MFFDLFSELSCIKSAELFGIDSKLEITNNDYKRKIEKW